MDENFVARCFSLQHLFTVFSSQCNIPFYTIVNAQAVLFSICLQDVDAMSKELEKLKQQEAPKPEEEMQQPKANQPEVN